MAAQRRHRRLGGLARAVLRRHERWPDALRLGVLAGGLVMLWALVANRWVDRWLSRIIAAALRRWTDLDVRDYSSLLERPATTR
jgi:hypothetical protein